MGDCRWVLVEERYSPEARTYIRIYEQVCDDGNQLRAAGRERPGGGAGRPG